MSPSDLKRIDKPDWIEPGKGEPTLMLYSIVDDRSGVAYQEYRCVYGEDAESALRFLFVADARADRIRTLADQLRLSIEALAGKELHLAPLNLPGELPIQPFDAEAHEFHFANVIAAKLTIADELASPLAKLSQEDRAVIDHVLSETLTRSVVLARIRDYFRNKKNG